MGTGSWRTKQYEKRKGNLYPTHGLGPVSQYMNLLRGEDTFKTLVSFSSPALGRKKFTEKNFDKNHKWRKLKIHSKSTLFFTCNLLIRESKAPKRPPRNLKNQGGTPQEFPDFTRGKWVSTKPFNIKP